MAELCSMPPEILLMILEKVPAKSHLAVKLASKILYQHTKKPGGGSVIDTSRLTGRANVEAHLAVEAKITSIKDVNHLVCTGCGKVKHRDCYVDAQWTLRNHRRFCIPCGINDSDYIARYFYFHGVKHFACHACKKPVPKSQEVKKPDGVKNKSSDDPLKDIKTVTGSKLKAKFCKSCVDDLKASYEADLTEEAKAALQPARITRMKSPLIDRYENRRGGFGFYYMLF